MHHRRRSVHVRLKYLAAALGVACSPQRDLDSTFRELISARNDAMVHGDTATVHRGISDDMQWVVGATGTTLTAPQLLSALSHVSNPLPEWTIDSVHARDLGDVATVTYRRIDRRRGGNYETTNWTRALEVYVHRDGRWVMINHSHTWIVQSPPTISMDSTALAAFVGHYQIGDGLYDDVHFEGGHLVATLSTQKVGGVLLPVSESAFSPDGVAPLIVFERDASGRVLGYVQGAPDGSVLRTRRIR